MEMDKSDYYEILGISRNSDEQEIKRAYKRLAIKYHPDRNPGNSESEAQFKKIKQAYEILSDKQKRAAYDQYGHSAFEHVNMGNGSTTADFSDIFGDVFGDIFGRGNSERSGRGSDLRYNIELSLEEAVKGVTRKISIPSLDKCNVCYGSGVRPGSTAITCNTCHGNGQIHIRQGFFSVQQTCPSCYGQGKIIKTPCYKCKGNGKISQTKTLLVKIPAGVNVGDRIRLLGEGEKGKSGSGDLYVQITIKEHPIFKREKNNLYCEIPINFAMAALGGEIEVPTLDGKVKLCIPPETQTGKLFRIISKGVKSMNSGHRGDLLCRVVVETPVKLSEHQTSLLKEFGLSLNGIKNSPRSKSFFNGLKKFFENLTR